MMVDPRKITLVGGAGQMGQLFYQLWQQQGHNVNILSRADRSSPGPILAGSDLVVITTPIANTPEVIDAVAPFLPEQAILADFTSIKKQPLAQMLAAHKGPVVGLHPLFGPTIASPSKQTIVICPGRLADACAWLQTSLGDLGFVLHTMTADDHDRAMDFIQGLEHFLTVTMAGFLRAQSVDFQQLLQLASPVYRLKLDLMGRILHQDAALYADIIRASEQRLTTISDFLAYGAQVLEQTQVSRDNFIDVFEHTAKWLDGFTDQAQQQTDRLLAEEI